MREGWDRPNGHMLPVKHNCVCGLRNTVSFNTNVMELLKVLKLRFIRVPTPWGRVAGSGPNPQNYISSDLNLSSLSPSPASLKHCLMEPRFALNSLCNMDQPQTPGLHNFSSQVGARTVRQPQALPCFKQYLSDHSVFWG